MNVRNILGYIPGRSRMEVVDRKDEYDQSYLTFVRMGDVLYLFDGLGRIREPYSDGVGLPLVGRFVAWTIWKYRDLRRGLR